MTERVPVRSVLRHLFVHGLSGAIIRYPGTHGYFQNFIEERCGCQRPRVRKNLFSSPTGLGGKKLHDVWGTHKREKEKTNNYSCQAVVRHDSTGRRSQMRLPLPSFALDLTDGADETSCTPNRGSLVLDQT